ncbi:MAG: SDR family oxidoreductase [Anaerolineaceae bacterium]
MSLSGKNILITGAARRIGRYLALSLAKAGANIFLHYAHSPGEAEETADVIRAMGARVTILSGDLDDPAVFTKTLPEFFANNDLFALINNAAIFEPLSLEDVTLENWNRHLNINLSAPFFLSQAFIRSMGKNKDGRIVNIVDWRALRPGPDHLPYTISKAALTALTYSLAAAAAPRVTVNAVALGAVLPPSDGGDVEKIIHMTPSRRLVGLDEVASTIIFLLDGPASITGEVIHIDGGRHLI